VNEIGLIENSRRQRRAEYRIARHCAFRFAPDRLPKPIDRQYFVHGSRSGLARPHDIGWPRHRTIRPAQKNEPPTCFSQMGGCIRRQASWGHYACG
jgi:hypothetical protein